MSPKDFRQDTAALLRRIEWASTIRVDYGHGDYSNKACCPDCGGWKPYPKATNPKLYGHTEGCPLAALLMEAE